MAYFKHISAGLLFSAAATALNAQTDGNSILTYITNEAEKVESTTQPITAEEYRYTKTKEYCDELQTDTLDPLNGLDLQSQFTAQFKEKDGYGLPTCEVLNNKERVSRVSSRYLKVGEEYGSNVAIQVAHDIFKSLPEEDVRIIHQKTMIPE